jgi:hypothetical protein
MDYKKILSVFLFYVLLLAVIFAGCGKKEPAAPDIEASVNPVLTKAAFKTATLTATQDISGNNFVYLTYYGGGMTGGNNTWYHNSHWLVR